MSEKFYPSRPGRLLTWDHSALYSSYNITASGVIDNRILTPLFDGLSMRSAPWPLLNALGMILRADNSVKGLSKYSEFVITGVELLQNTRTGI